MNFDPPPFTLRHLQYAVAVAESLSFRKAAELCRVSQPSLSAQLAQMEKALGVRLFERDQRRVLVTAAGRELIERARRILRGSDDFMEFASRMSDPLSGTLRIGVIPTIAPYLLPHLIAPLGKAYPRLALLWTENKTHALLRDLEAGTLDAALLSLEAVNSDVQRETIAWDPFVLVVPPGIPLAERALPVKISDLQNATVLVLQDEHCFGQQAVAFCSNINASVNAFRATSLTTLVRMVVGGRGVTLLPELAAPHEVASTNLCVRTFCETTPGRTIGLVWRKRFPLDSALRQIAATIRRAYPVPRPRRTQRRRQTRQLHIARKKSV
jgi:LysR family hydrogen peroxide-inducible transcriptional activator